MDRVHLFVVILALTGLPAGALAAESPAAEGRILDLTGDLATDLGTSSPWMGDVEPCAGFWGRSGQALLGAFRVGALFLNRDHPKARPVSQIVRTADGAPLWDATDLRMGTETGLDLAFLVALCSALDLEIRYFGIDGWDASQVVSDPGGVTFNGFGLTTTDLSQRVDYFSRLYSIEVAIRPRVIDSIPLVLGFRHVQLHENFEVRRLDPLPEAPDLGAHTRNYLYGFQLGVEPYLFGAGTPLRVEGVFKAGIYGNHASQSSFSPVAGTVVEATDNRTSFVGEAGLTLAYRFSTYFTIRGGYEVLWLYGVALAPDQSSTTNFLSPTSQLNDKSTAFLHGATVGLEFVF